MCVFNMKKNLLFYKRHSQIHTHLHVHREIAANVKPREYVDYADVVEAIIISVPATWFYWEKPTSLQLLCWQ